MKSRPTYLLALALLPLLLVLFATTAACASARTPPRTAGRHDCGIDTAIVRPEKIIERTITLEELSALAHDTAETRDSVENGTEKNKISIAADGMEAAIVVTPTDRSHCN